VIPISPFCQNSALVGQALMQSLHSNPWQVRLLTLIFPFSKSSFTPIGPRSSSLRFLRAALFPLSDIMPNMSMPEELSLDIYIQLIGCDLKRIAIVNYNYLSPCFSTYRQQKEHILSILGQHNSAFPSEPIKPSSKDCFSFIARAILNLIDFKAGDFIKFEEKNTCSECIGRSRYAGTRSNSTTSEKVNSFSEMRSISFFQKPS
jgi:hypothetical protein